MKYESAIEQGALRTQVPELAVVTGQAPLAIYRPLSPAKRAFDFVLALSLLIFTLPLLASLALLVKMTDGGQVLFRQQRRGLNGEYFACWKFRTMVMDADQRLAKVLAGDPRLAEEWQCAQKLKDDPRITGIGRFLRKSSLDELPQLINILRGEMSIVGPRPIIANEVARYGDAIIAYDSVRPGVTGLWQISGRSDTCYDKRVALDVAYAQTNTIWGDLKILAKTLPVVLFGSGAY